MSANDNPGVANQPQTSIAFTSQTSAPSKCSPPGSCILDCLPRDSELFGSLREKLQQRFGDPEDCVDLQVALEPRLSNIKRKLATCQSVSLDLQELSTWAKSVQLEEPRCHGESMHGDLPEKLRLFSLPPTDTHACQTIVSLFDLQWRYELGRDFHYLGHDQGFDAITTEWHDELALIPYTPGENASLTPERRFRVLLATSNALTKTRKKWREVVASRVQDGSLFLRTEALGTGLRSQWPYRLSDAETKASQLEYFGKSELFVQSIERAPDTSLGCGGAQSPSFDHIPSVSKATTST